MSKPEVTVRSPTEGNKKVSSGGMETQNFQDATLTPSGQKRISDMRDDWAMLGAVRRPDHIFDTSTNTKHSARGVSQLEDSRAAQLASLHQEVAQATAHTLCPLAVAHQAASTAS